MDKVAGRQINDKAKRPRPQKRLQGKDSLLITYSEMGPSLGVAVRRS